MGVGCELLADFDLKSLGLEQAMPVRFRLRAPVEQTEQWYACVRSWGHRYVLEDIVVVVEREPTGAWRIDEVHK